MTDLIVEALKNVVDRELTEQAEVREEIKQRGTVWAAAEIWKLRRQVKARRKRLAEHDGDTQR
jgi:hypothetical protein